MQYKVQYMGHCKDTTKNFTCLRQLAGNPSMMKRLGSEVRRSTEKYHDIDKTSKQLGQIYNELL